MSLLSTASWTNPGPTSLDPSCCSTNGWCQLLSLVVADPNGIYSKCPRIGFLKTWWRIYPHSLGCAVSAVSKCSHGLGRGATRRSRNSEEFLRDALTFAGAGLRYHAEPELARWSRIGLLFYLSHKESAE